MQNIHDSQHRMPLIAGETRYLLLGLGKLRLRTADEQLYLQCLGLSAPLTKHRDRRFFLAQN